MHTHTCADIQTNTSTQQHKHACAFAHRSRDRKHAHTQMHTYTSTDTIVHTHAHSHACTHTSTLARAHRVKSESHTHVNANARAHKHTHTLLLTTDKCSGHTYTQAQAQACARAFTTTQVSYLRREPCSDSIHTVLSGALASSPHCSCTCFLLPLRVQTQEPSTESPIEIFPVYVCWSADCDISHSHTSPCLVTAPLTFLPLYKHKLRISKNENAALHTAHTMTQPPCVCTKHKASREYQCLKGLPHSADPTTL